MSHGDETPLSCSKCSAVWQKCGATNCWSGNPDTAPPKPGNCPSTAFDGIIDESFDEYLSASEDARMAQVAARVEGLCYQPVPGSDAVNARWTRVEDTIAFAKLMGYRKIGIATCIGLLEETDRLVAILTAPASSPRASAARRGASTRAGWG